MGSEPQLPGALTDPPAPVITTEMIAMAGVSLIQRGVDAGAVLREFGVNSVAELTKDQLVPVAMRLRQLGANI